MALLLLTIIISFCSVPLIVAEIISFEFICWD
jgi:hypothetical protein